MSTNFVGNRPIRLLLHQSIRRNTLSHAYIFSGSDGLGKKRLALQVAKSINCPKGGEGLQFCNSCISCKKIQNSTHPDVQVISPETKVFKIDQVRKIIQELYYLPFEGQGRIFILEHAEKMNEQAANSLLKTLEEPSDKSILILLTTNLYALLPTIRSRCQVLKFMSISVQDIESQLGTEHGYSPENAAVAARLSQGSLGAALSLDLKAVKHLETWSFQLLELMTSADDAALNKHLLEITIGKGKGSDQTDLWLKIFVSILRDLVIMEYFRDRDHILHYDYLDILITLRDDFQHDIVQGILYDLEDLYGKRHLNLNIDLAFQNLIIKHREILLRRRQHGTDRIY